MLRLGVLIVCAGAVGQVWAQDMPQRILNEGFMSWRGLSPLKVTIEGTEFFGTDKRTFSTEIWYQLDEGKVYLDVAAYSGNRMRRRIVADGERIWIFDADRKTYASSDYTQGAQALKAAAANSSGHAGIAVTLLNDVLTAPEARWMLPAAARELYVKPQELEDPIWGTGRVFRPEADEAYILQRDLQDPTREVIYHLQRPSTGWKLHTVYGAERTPGDKLGRQTIWSLAIDKLPESFSREYKFIPPKDASVVAMPPIRSGG
ncbi:MAG: hypothetical protein HONBIEJF_01100 [Fimbriimonadaceae bacterium]|nr:hypothetical protein [Fimbriimonadaceae bacterium]